MRKIILLLALIIGVVFSNSLFAQSNYKTAIGLGIDFGDGSTIVGPTAKYFFDSHNAISAEALFGDHFGAIGAFYQYHRSFKEAKELQWYLGIGPEVLYTERDAEFALRPMVGLDYKLKKLPLSLVFDWRPIVTIGEYSSFGAARFELGIRYIIK